MLLHIEGEQFDRAGSGHHCVAIGNGGEVACVPGGGAEIMFARPSRLRLLAETARQRAVQGRALHLQSGTHRERPQHRSRDYDDHEYLGDDPEFEIGWGTMSEGDVPRDPAAGDRADQRGESRRAAAREPKES
jgi:hypothetical protein